MQAFILAWRLGSEVYCEVDAHSEAFNRVEAIELCVHAIHVELFRSIWVFRSVNGVASHFLVAILIILDLLRRGVSISVNCLVCLRSWISIHVIVSRGACARAICIVLALHLSSAALIAILIIVGGVRLGGSGASLRVRRSSSGLSLA